MYSWYLCNTKLSMNAQTFRRIENRIIIEVGERRLWHDRLIKFGRRDRKRRRIGHFAKISDKLHVVRVDHCRFLRFRHWQCQSGRRGLVRGRSNDSHIFVHLHLRRLRRNGSRSRRRQLRHRWIEVVSLNLVLGAHEVLHFLFVLGMGSSIVMSHQAQPDCSTIFIAAFPEKVNFFLGECRHRDGLDSVRRSKSSSAMTMGMPSRN